MVYNLFAGVVLSMFYLKGEEIRVLCHDQVLRKGMQTSPPMSGCCITPTSGPETLNTTTLVNSLASEN